MLGHIMAQFAAANSGKKGPANIKIEDYMLPPYNKAQTKQQSPDELSATLHEWRRRMLAQEEKK